MPIIREQLTSKGNVGTTWPSGAKNAISVAPRDPVDEAGDESFPCSDPPSWTLGRSAAAPAEARENSRPRSEPVRLHEVEVTRLSEIPEGEIRGIEVEGREIGLCKLREQVFALSGSCSYHPIPLQGAKVDGEVLTCQWYGAQFDVRTGESVFMRLVNPLATYRTAVREGRVFVQVPIEPAEPSSSRWVGAEQ